MTLQQKFNEYIASGDPIIGISDEQRDWILPFIERCVGEEREQEREDIALWIEEMNEPTTNIMTVASRNEIVLILRRFKTPSTQEDKIK